MAVGGNPRKDSKWQKLEEEITCPICSDVFTNPITTPCLHTFCRECLKASIEATMAEICPICRGALSRALDCPVDFRIKRIIKTFKQLLPPRLPRQFTSSRTVATAHSSKACENVDNTRFCGKCEENVSTVIWCIECQASLCYDCYKIHAKWKEFNYHTSIVPIRKYMSNYVINGHSSNGETLISQGQSGYGEVIQKTHIPREYLEKSLETYSWYFGAITKKDAEMILMQPICGYKSFLVRDCERKPHDYILSIRDTFQVRHYQIHRLGDEFCISLLTTFKTVIELISHYTQRTGESCCPVQRYGSDYKWYSHCYGSNIHFTRMVEVYQFYELWDGDWCYNPVTIRKLKNVSVGIPSFLEEVKLMQQLKHKCNNILWPFGICSLETPLCIITERTCGNLKSYLNVKGNALTTHQIIDIGMQVASAMIYLESVKCVHRSLCAKNVALVFSHKFIFKVTNFTLARIISKHDHIESTPQEQFPIKWTAPESLRTNRFTTKSDVWSFGVVVYETTTRGGDPYPRMDDSEMLTKLDAGYRMPCPTGCPERLYTIIIKKCWRKNADRRPTFVIICESLKQICTCMSCSRRRNTVA